MFNTLWRPILEKMTKEELIEYTNRLQYLVNTLQTEIADRNELINYLIRALSISNDMIFADKAPAVSAEDFAKEMKKKYPHPAGVNVPLRYYPKNMAEQLNESEENECQEEEQEETGE